MKTSNKLIIITILIIIAAPVFYGFLLIGAAKNNLAKGLEFEKKVLSDTVNVSTGNFNSVNMNVNPRGIDNSYYFGKIDGDLDGSFVNNQKVKITIQNGDSSFVRFYGASSFNIYSDKSLNKRLNFDNEKENLKIKRFYCLPYFQLSKNSYYKMYLKMNAPDLEIIAPSLYTIESRNRQTDIKFDNFTTNSLIINTSASLVDGHINAKQIVIFGEGNTHINLNASTAIDAQFDIYNNSTLEWGTVKDTMIVFKNNYGVIKIKNKVGYVNFANTSLHETSVLMPDSTGKIIDVAKEYSAVIKKQNQMMMKQKQQGK